jgi:hypothetical protein
MKKLVLLALLCCAQFGLAQGRHSGVAGEAFINSCPVIGPFECPLTPYETTISVYSERGRLIKEVETDENGLFAVKLNPGVYTLVPAGPPPLPPPAPGFPPVELIYPRAEPVTVEVKARRFTEITIIYDSGVR